MHLLVSEHHPTGACQSSLLAIKSLGGKIADFDMKSLLFGVGLFCSSALLDFVTERSP